MSKLLTDTVSIEVIKEKMGYKNPIQCCKQCNYFVSMSRSGVPDAKLMYCTLSPAFDLPVEEAGYCKHFILNYKQTVMNREDR